MHLRMGAALLGVFIILSTISIHSTLAGKWRVHVSMQAIYIRVFLILAIWERGGIIFFVCGILLCMWNFIVYAHLILF